MSPEPSTSDREELLARARAALAKQAADVDGAHERFLARLEAEADQGTWKNARELKPLLLSWGRMLILGGIAFAIVTVSWAQCPLYEHSVADPDAPPREAPLYDWKAKPRRTRPGEPMPRLPEGARPTPADEPPDATPPQGVK